MKRNARRQRGAAVRLMKVGEGRTPTPHPSAFSELGGYGELTERAFGPVGAVPERLVLVSSVRLNLAEAD